MNIPPIPRIPQVNVPYEVPLPRTHIPQVHNIFSNLRNDLFNNVRNIPFDIQISNFIPFNNYTNEENTPVGIALSNINTITNVMRYCDFTESNISDNCSICQIAFNNIDICRLIKSCKHIFHLECIDTWLGDHTTCPCCRNNLLNTTPNTTNTTTNPTTDILINDVENSDNYDDNNYDDNNYDDNNYDDNYDDNNYDDEEDVEDDDEYYVEEDQDVKDEEFHFDENLPELVDNLINSDFENNENHHNHENHSQTNYEPRQHFSRVFTSTSNTSPIFNTEPILNDINNFVNITTPFINSFISNSNSNASVRLNSNEINTQINRQFNNFVNNINPLLQSFGNFGGNRY